MSIVSAHTPRKGRNVELALVVGAVGIVLLAYLNVELATTGTIPPGTLTLVGGYLVSRCGYVAGTAPALPALLQLRTNLVVAPLTGLGLAAAAIAFYPLSRARLIEIQLSLSERRTEGTRSL